MPVYMRSMQQHTPEKITLALINMPQNPDAIKLKEEISRLSKKIKAGQPVLAESQKELADKRRKLAKIQADLEDLTAGENALARLEVGKAWCCLQGDGCSAAPAGRACKTKA